MMRSIRNGVARPASGGVFAAALCMGFGLAQPATAQVVTDPGLVIQIIQTSTWSPSAPDPAGITYRPETGEFLTCDSEVDEMSIWAGANLWTHSNTGVVSSSASTLAFSNEPAGLAFSPEGDLLWIADDNADKIWQIDLGADGLYGTADDTVLDLDGLAAVGCPDVEDVTYNPVNGHLYVGAGALQAICEIAPGLDLEFNGAPPTGDDVVTVYDVSVYGIIDPEGIVYDPFWDTLVVADRKGEELYELTTTGDLLRKIDVNFPGGSKLSGVAIAPGSTNPLLRNYYVTDRRIDNNVDPLENDGRIFEVVAIPLGGNAAPVVDAGQPQELEWPIDTTALDGFVTDDGHPYPPSTLLSTWSQLSGPGVVSFDDAANPLANATFSEPGAYELQLTGDDSALQTTDTVIVTVSHNVTLSTSATGPGSVTLDPPGGVYPAGTSVTVTATPDPDSAFLGWSGDLAGTTNPESVVMDADKSVTGAFATLYDVAISATGPGSVTLDPPGGTYPAGTVVTVTATPDASAQFDGFGGDLTGTTSPQPLTVDADKTVTAGFTALFTLSTGANGPGSVALDPPGGVYPAGSSVTVTAVPDASAAFTGWSGALAGATNPESVLMDGPKAVTADFVALHTVTLDVTGPGSVTLDPPGGTYPVGTEVTVTATPDAEASFDGFGGDLLGTTTPQPLTVDADKTVSASFSAFYALDLTTEGNGSVAAEPASGPYAWGSMVTLTAQPATGNVLDTWSGDATGKVNPVEVMMDGPKAVHARFTVRQSSTSCGMGPELVAAIPLIAWLRRRRQRRRA